MPYLTLFFLIRNIVIRNIDFYSRILLLARDDIIVGSERREFVHDSAIFRKKFLGHVTEIMGHCFVELSSQGAVNLG